MLTKKQVERIAELSRIDLTENEIEKYQHDLEAILDYIKKLNEVDTDSVNPTSHVIGSENFVRDDRKISENDYELLIEQAPASENGYFRVKSVL